MCALPARLSTFPPYTEAEIAFLRAVEEDTEEQPWMVMNDRQFNGAAQLVLSLQQYRNQRGLRWYVGGMLPLLYRVPGRRRRKQVAPDALVALMENRQLDSLDIETLGMPAFVLEMVSASSVQHDLEQKTELYRILGAQEYAIARLDQRKVILDGYHRSSANEWVPWPRDTHGRLWSEVLQLYLAIDEHSTVGAQDKDGHWLPTLASAEEARQQAEAEVVRLRSLLEQQE